MSAFCWFAVFSHAPALPSADFLRSTPGASSVLLHTPGATSDPYLDDGAPPPLALQVFFPAAEALEAALGGHLGRLPDLLPGATAVQQAMVARRVPVPGQGAGAALQCTYLVSYEGEADDPGAWLDYYLRHHTPLMARFPAVRRVEVYSRMEWAGGPAWPRATAFQRNKVVFDDAHALRAALNSPVRHAMRNDFARFPPFSGRNTHFPMTTRVLL